MAKELDAPDDTKEWSENMYYEKLLSLRANADVASAIQGAG